ncbi:MAG: hypothetical protein NC342_04855 [Pseudoflavonifractor sp.]|nr:hypothetical protein [Alloprevotella sp.]MCM1116847.1 hypothetical protein [Pseudoflavonifractor sp.]
MDIQNIIAELTSRFGGNFDIAAVTQHLKGLDLNNISMTEIIAKVKDGGFLGDLDGDGIQESAFEEIKGKIGSIFGK